MGMVTENTSSQDRGEKMEKERFAPSCVLSPAFPACICARTGSIETAPAEVGIWEMHPCAAGGEGWGSSARSHGSSRGSRVLTPSAAAFELLPCSHNFK